jgi:hypothetical protein
MEIKMGKEREREKERQGENIKTERETGYGE